MRRLIFLAFAFTLLTSSATLSFTRSTDALSGNEFQSNRIIDDAVFFNKEGMSQQQIQEFLNAKVPVCNTNHTRSGSVNDSGPPYICLKDYRQDTGSKSAEDGLCGALSAGNKSSAQIIWEVAQACGVNPKVLLVLLQKEQSLVTDDWPWSIQYRSATGYGCPDTAPCDTEYYGFFNQVYNAARIYRRYARNATSYNHRVNRSSYVGYNPNGACGGTNIVMQNQATAGLYNYTPYQPNQAALNNLYNTGDSCSAYGNRNFWRMFNDWFGSPFSNRPLLTNTTHPDGSLIQEGGRNEVYLVIGQVRYHVLSPDVLNSRGYSWSEVRQATLKDVTLPISEDPLTFRSGTLVRGDSDNKIFFLRCGVSECTKYHIIDLPTFLGLGYNAGLVKIAPQSMVNAMVEGAAITSSTAHPQDSLVIDPSNGKVYIIGVGYKHWIPSLAIFAANHFRWEQVEVATTTDLALPESTIGFAEGAIIRHPEAPNVYVVDQDEFGNYSKRFVAGQNVFAGLGYSPSDVLVDPNLPGPNGPDLTE